MISKKIIKRSLVGVGSALTLTLGIAFAVNAMDKEEGKQATDTKVQASYTFEYNKPSDFSQASVEDEANWKYTTNTEMCSGENEKPCKIKVSASYVNNPSTTPTLKTTTNISAAMYATNMYYVNGIADSFGSISNRPN